MPLLLRVLGAFLATYVLSRLIGRLLEGLLSGTPRVLVTHTASLAILAVFVGLLKAYGTRFQADAGLIYVVPQLVWLAYDLVRIPIRR